MPLLRVQNPPGQPDADRVALRSGRLWVLSAPHAGRDLPSGASAFWGVRLKPARGSIWKCSAWILSLLEAHTCPQHKGDGQAFPGATPLPVRVGGTCPVSPHPSPHNVRFSGKEKTSGSFLAPELLEGSLTLSGKRNGRGEASPPVQLRCVPWSPGTKSTGGSWQECRASSGL